MHSENGTCFVHWLLRGPNDFKPEFDVLLIHTAHMMMRDLASIFNDLSDATNFTNTITAIN